MYCYEFYDVKHENLKGKELKEYNELRKRKLREEKFAKKHPILYTGMMICQAVILGAFFYAFVILMACM